MSIMLVLVGNVWKSFSLSFLIYISEWHNFIRTSQFYCSESQNSVRTSHWCWLKTSRSKWLCFQSETQVVRNPAS